MIFTEDYNNYSLKVNPLQSPEELNKGLWLVIAGVNDIPPHIALIADGKYYSVTARKVKVGEPIDKFLKAISPRSLPTLFVSIKSSNTDRLKEIFDSYPPLGNGEHTCHWPIRDFFVRAFSLAFTDATLVFELLSVAQKQGLLLACKSLFVNLNSEAIVLPKYTSKQIREKINSILKINE
jgi:hypothetical protein